MSSTAWRQTRAAACSGRIESGEVDPYAAALEILSDERRLRAIVKDGRTPQSGGDSQRKRDE